MKKPKQKGFTLVELLAVIVIIALVSLVGTVSIAAVRNKTNQNMFESKLKLAMESAKLYGQDNKASFDIDKSVLVTVEDLINSGKLQTSEVDDNNNKIVTDNTTGNSINKLEIKIYLVNNRIYSCIDTSENNKALLEGDSEAKIAESDYKNLYCDYESDGNSKSESDVQDSIDKEEKPTMDSGGNNVSNSKQLYGDVDEDGKVTEEDANYLLYYSLYGEEDYPLTPQGKKNADVNLDGVINETDAIIIKYHVDKTAGYETLPYTN